MLLSRVNNSCTLLLLILAIIVIRELATIIVVFALRSQFDHIERVFLKTAKVTVLAKDGSRISANLLLDNASFNLPS